MAPQKRPRSVEEHVLQEENLFTEGASSGLRQSSAKRPRISQTRKLGPFVLDESENDQSPGPAPYSRHASEAAYELRATQVIKEKFAKEVANHPADNGVIESIHCANFMCHENWTLELNPLINFIVGKNGSGKSAALTAITLCLGGKASSTNRGQSLKNFITEGHESGGVTVKIKNQGDGAYMHEEYGDAILVERHFSKSGGSGFKLRSANGRIVSTKRADLDNICDFFNLQIDNPMNVLSQDMSRQFLTTSTPQDKYKFYVRGVQLEQLDHDYGVIEETIENIEVKLASREEDIKVLADRKESANHKLAMSDRQDTMRDRVANTRRQMAWCQVEGKERERDEITEDLRKQDELVAEAEGEAAKYDDRYEEANRAAQLSTQEAEEARTEVQAAMDVKTEAKAKHDKIKEDLSKLQSEQRQIRSEIVNSQDRIKRAREEIAEEEKRLADLDGGSHARRRAEIDDKKSELADWQKRLEDHREDLARLGANRDAADKSLREMTSKVTAKKDEVNGCGTLIKNLTRDRGDINSGYHPKLPQLLRAIQEERSFDERPVGPIGHHIRLKDQKWSPILESAFGSTLNSFVVTSKKDQASLQRIMHRVGCPQIPILIGRNNPIDTSRHEPDIRFKTWLRVLEINNDLVKQQIVINHSIEQVILIESRQEANDVMTNGPRPNNVKNCLYMEQGRGRMLSYTRTGEPRDGPINIFTGLPRMQTDAEQQISYQRERLLLLKQELNEMEGQHRETRNSSEKAKQAIVRHGKDEQILRTRVQRAEDEIFSLDASLDEDRVEEGRLEGLKSELQSAEDQKQIADNSAMDIINARDSAKALLEEQGKDLALKDKLVKDVDAKVSKLDEKAAYRTRNRESILREKNAAYENVNNKEEARKAMDEKYQKAIADVQDYIRRATQISQRVNVDRGQTYDSLGIKLDRLKRDLDRAERELGGTRIELANLAQKASEAYNTAKAQVTDLHELVQLLKRTLEIRKDRWLSFRALISARAKSQFMYLLSERGFRGKILTSHKEKVLDLLVEPDRTRESGKGNQTKTLSGGEKSFSTICLLLALWEAMGSPIRAMDEFDVFMDQANRAAAIRMLITAARRSVGRQFLFITPGENFKSMSDLADVKFTELAEPERGQTRLSFPKAS